jgi:hypothetical protein
MKKEINTQRHSPSNPQEQAEPRLEAGEGLDGTTCSASSFVSLREYDRMVTNYDKLRMAVIGDVLPEMSDGYTLLRTDWKVEER